MTSERSKLFQDATQGYIKVDEIYVDELIDTHFMQREKNVSQVGLQPIFSGATHNRFAHSLGVYNIGTQIFSTIKRNFSKQVFNNLAGNKLRLENMLEKYEVLFHIACLLHDIGHPAYSHTLEYLFNDDYVDLASNNASNLMELKDVVTVILDRYLILQKDSNMQGKVLMTAFKRELIKKEKSNKGTNVKTAPHEIMGAYQILTSDEIRQAIQNVVQVKLNSKLTDDWLAFIARMITGCQYDLKEVIKNCKKDCVANKLKEKYSLRNCIIGLLNGKLDADTLDYLNRNAHFAGYASNNIDLHRLCSAFTIHYYDQTHIFVNCIAKSALSSLDGVIQARQFEPKWLYSHHKVVYYNDVLLKYLVKMSGANFFEYHQKDLEKAIFDELFTNQKYSKLLKTSTARKFVDACLVNFNSTKPSTITVNKKKMTFEKCRQKILTTLFKTNQHPSNFNKVTLRFEYDLLSLSYTLLLELCNLLQNSKNSFSKISRLFDNLMEFIICLNDIVTHIKYACTDIILAPNTKFKYTGEFFAPYVFYKTTDADFEKVFKDIKDNRLRINSRQKLYADLLEEFHTRKYRKSLWKSYAEYRLFIDETIEGTPLNFDQASELLLQLIEKYSFSDHCIEFEDIVETMKSDSKKRLRNMEVVYINSSQLSPYNKIDEFKEVFGCLGEDMILRIYHGKYKSFENLLIKFENSVEEYTKFCANKSPKDFYIPYIYYKEPDDASNNSRKLSDDNNNSSNDSYRQNLLAKLKKTLKRYYLNNCGEAQSMNIENISSLDGEIIRDSVHGDIFIPYRFLSIIECKAFQRMHRIKQLATANFVFPEAVHTRFAHSLGTFYVMTKMIEHFCSLFKKLNIEYTQREIDIVLVAALLHDIGHGPLSHTFEKIPGNISHEEWTKRIILEDDELKTVLQKQWDILFPQEVVDCLSRKSRNPYSLGYVFSELISSNLDADRIDYLMRDSQNTGEKFGIFDIQKLISAMILTEYNGKLCVALSSNALPAIEQFIEGRYNMYSMVYFSPYKLMSEQLFKNICTAIVENTDRYRLDSDPKIRDIGENLRKLSIYKLYKSNLSVKEYLQMDDYSIMHDITNAVKSMSSLPSGKKYQYMLEGFLYRKGYERKHILYDSLQDFDIFEQQLQHKSYFSKLQYSVIKTTQNLCAYEREIGMREKEILVVMENGEVKRFSDASKFKENFGNSRKLWNTGIIAFYLNETILAIELQEVGVKNLQTEIIALSNLIDSYDINKHTEIENKYFCTNIVFENAKKQLYENQSLSQYFFGPPKNKQQCDVYYDTDFFDLARNNYSLRCRALNGKFIFTLKKPGSLGDDINEAQFIRLEFELENPTDDVKDEKVLTFLRNNLLPKELTNLHIELNEDRLNLHKVVKIKNNRTYYTVKDKDVPKFECEMAFDRIEYCAINGTSKKEMEDYQIEMELKCNCLYRVKLNDLAKKFCKAMGIDEKNDKATLSKYRHALHQLGLLQKNN